MLARYTVAMLAASQKPLLKRAGITTLILVLIASLLITDVQFVAKGGLYAVKLEYRGGIIHLTWLNAREKAIESYVWSPPDHNALDKPMMFMSVGGRNRLEVKGRPMF